MLFYQTPSRGIPGRMKGIGLQRRISELEKAIGLLVREAAREVLGSDKWLRESFELHVSCTVEPGERWKVQFPESLADQVREILQEVTARSNALKQGHIYCYRCESTTCEHSLPSSPTEVFGGYSPTGIPKWLDFHQLLLAKGHPQVADLFESDSSNLLALYMDGHSLREEQLEVFGRMSLSYEILGQVVFGLIKVGSERIALTAQAVQYKGPRGKPRVDLNLLGGLGTDGSPWDLLQETRKGRLPMILSHARRSLQTLGSKMGKERNSHREDAERVLRAMAKKLERWGRQARRRTTHAEIRSEERRPTCKALEDVGCAGPGRILWDELRRTVVVLGMCERVHVFSLEGRHITSFFLDGDSVEKRLRKGRWRPMEDGIMSQFQLAVERMAAATCKVEEAQK